MRGRQRRSRLRKCALFLFRGIAYASFLLTLHIISYITRTQAQAEGAPPLERASARSAPASLSVPLRGNEASKSTASNARCTVARASGGLMYWMGRDNGNAYF